MFRFFSAVQRPATFSPDKWITASHPDTSTGETSRIGSQTKSVLILAEPRTSRATSYPPDSSAGTSADPIKPEAPLIRIRVITKEFYFSIDRVGAAALGCPLGESRGFAPSRYNQKQPMTTLREQIA